VLDLGSTNRTRVNGVAVSERELKDGDEVRFARACCKFVLSGDISGPEFAPEVS